jgi:hypothetical protein
MNFTVRVYDNLHEGAAEEFTSEGPFSAYQEALTAAQEVVGKSVARSGWDYHAYTSYGQDAVIEPTPEGVQQFSAWSYARELCDQHRKR